MADQGLFQSSQHSQTLLAQRQEIASDAAEGLSARSRAEVAGDLLLYFDHPQVTFGEAVVERHDEVVQEGQHSLLVLGKAIEQIASRRRFAPTFLTCFWWRIQWVSLRAFGQQGSMVSFPVLHLQRMQTAADGCWDSPFSAALAELVQPFYQGVLLLKQRLLPLKQDLLQADLLLLQSGSFPQILILLSQFFFTVMLLLYPIRFSLASL
jgi:hypothetical protein